MNDDTIISLTFADHAIEHHHLIEIESTNSYLQETAGQNQIDRLVSANLQKHGRGRLGRTWHSPPGVNIYASLLYHHKFGPQALSSLPLVVSVALKDAIEQVCNFAATIKWPNDILADKRKLGGVLCEIANANAVIIGFGINVNMEPCHFPSEIENTASSIYIETGHLFNRNLLLSSIIQNLYQLFKMISDGQLALKKWRQYSSTIGKKVTIVLDGEKKTGRAVDIDDWGRLRIENQAGDIITVIAGDIIH